MPQFPFYSYPKVYITVRTRIPLASLPYESSWLWGGDNRHCLAYFFHYFRPSHMSIWNHSDRFTGPEE